MGDSAFRSKDFQSFADTYDIQLKPLPPRRHNKNVLQSKHKVIRDIFLRLQHENSDNNVPVDGEMLVLQALRISNDLYGSDTMSSNELAKGYTRPILNGKLPIVVPDEIREAHNKLLAKRKLALIMKSKATVDMNVRPGDLVEVYIRQQNEKRGKWTAPRPVLSFDRATGTLEVPGTCKRKNFKSSFRRCSPCNHRKRFGKQIQESIDELETQIGNDLADSAKSDFDDENNVLDFSTCNDIDDDHSPVSKPIRKIICQLDC